MFSKSYTYPHVNYVMFLHLPTQKFTSVFGINENVFVA